MPEWRFPRLGPREDVSPVVKAALAHSQFESIHPFVHANGRVGRALIHVCLARRGVSPVATPPISLFLVTNKREYFDAFAKTQRHTGEVDRHEAINDWVSCFCGAVSEACADMARIANEMVDIRARWESALGRVRFGSSLELILDEKCEASHFSSKTTSGLTRGTIGRN